MFEFCNEYGRLVLVPVTDDIPVSTISSPMVPDECFFDLDTAEAVALITGNKGIQIAFNHRERPVRAYVMHHSSSSVARVCRIEQIVFNGNGRSAREIITESVRRDAQAIAGMHGL